jgi:hypothetical protein
MTRDLLLKYLKHLDGLIGELERRHELTSEHVASLHSELLQFRTRVSTVDFLGPQAKQLALSIGLRMNGRHVEGSRCLSWLSIALYPVAFGAANRVRKAEQTERIRNELERVRSEVRQLHYAAQF